MVKVATRTPASGLRHVPRLHGAHFSALPETSLHRYLDDQFVPRFLQDAQLGRLTGTAEQSWFVGDRFGRDPDHPTLRLPMHRAFYLACCEVSCRRFHAPAFDPKRIVSAGLVVRRVKRDGTIQRWMLQDGQPLGWVEGPLSSEEPSDFRRLLNRKLMKARYPEPPYSGEETYPMHALPVQRSAGGRTRKHTLLWGYLPLGGSYREAAVPAIPASGPGAPALNQEHNWPFGSLNAHAWTPWDGLQADQGRATEALRQLLETLLFRHRIQLPDPDNDPLRTVLGRVHFYAPEGISIPMEGGDWGLDPAFRRESLLDYLTGSQEALQAWLSSLARGETTLGSAPLPIQTGIGGEGEPLWVNRDDRLYCSELDARDLRDLLILRSRRAMQYQAEGLALPRFGQGEDDRFQVVPFLRWRDVCGCERITWGPPSTRFRVVSPLDPEAQRPMAIQLPELADLRRGAARGVALLAPKSLADIIAKIKPGTDFKSGGPGNRAGICMSFSFSLPVITLCAMILLMGVLSLLNLFFGWLPWAFLALPRLCSKSDKGA